jgi:hypothetical protein
MATPRRTVIGPTCVSNAEDNTTQQLANRVKIPPVKCGLYGGAHTANYKDCEYYHNLTRNRNATPKPQVSNVKYSTASVSEPVALPLNT